MSNYLTELRKRFDQVSNSDLDQKVVNLFGDFYNVQERLRKTCRVVWEGFGTRRECDPNKNTLSFFSNPNEMEQTLECFLSILLASKKVSIEPLTPDEIRSRWENGGDIVLCTKRGEKYRKSLYTISHLDQAEYEKTGVCWCHNIRNNDSNRRIQVQPDRHLVYPASFSVNARPFDWNYEFCVNADAAHFHEHTKLETPIFIFDHGTTAEKVLSSIMIGGVSAWEYFSVVNVRRDGDIRSISSKSDPSIFIFSDTDHATRFLRRHTGPVIKNRFSKVISVFYNTDQLFSVTANKAIEYQLSIRSLADILEQESESGFSSDNYSGLKERGVVFFDGAYDDEHIAVEIHKVEHNGSIADRWREFYTIVKSIKKYSDNDMLFPIFCKARWIFNQLRQPFFDEEKCCRLAREIQEGAKVFRSYIDGASEMVQIVEQLGRISEIIGQVLSFYSCNMTEKSEAIIAYVKLMSESDRMRISFAGRRDWIQKELSEKCGVNISSDAVPGILIHFKRQKKYHKNSAWIFPDRTIKNVWFLYEDEYQELESIKKVYHYISNKGVANSKYKGEILGFEVPDRPAMGSLHHSATQGDIKDVLTTEQILSGFNPVVEYDGDIYSTRKRSSGGFCPQLYRSLSFESGCRAELTRWTEVIVERDGLRETVAPGDICIGDTVWMMLDDEMIGVSAHGFDDGASLKDKWVNVLSHLLKTRYEGDKGRLVDGINNEIRRQGANLSVSLTKVGYWLKGCTLCPDGAAVLFKALGVLSGDDYLKKNAESLERSMLKINSAHQSVGRNVYESFRNALIGGMTTVAVGGKKFETSRFFSRQIVVGIREYDDTDESSDDDVAEKIRVNRLIK